jgi:hypothetical protein
LEGFFKLPHDDLGGDAATGDELFTNAESVRQQE